jgi:hypothetical protein
MEDISQQLEEMGMNASGFPKPAHYKSFEIVEGIISAITYSNTLLHTDEPYHHHGNTCTKHKNWVRSREGLERHRIMVDQCSARLAAEVPPSYYQTDYYKSHQRYRLQLEFPFRAFQTNSSNKEEPDCMVFPRSPFQRTDIWFIIISIVAPHVGNEGLFTQWLVMALEAASLDLSAVVNFCSDLLRTRKANALARKHILNYMTRRFMEIPHKILVYMTSGEIEIWDDLYRVTPSQQREISDFHFGKDYYKSMVTITKAREACHGTIWVDRGMISRLLFSCPNVSVFNSLIATLGALNWNFKPIIHLLAGAVGCYVGDKDAMTYMHECYVKPHVEDDDVFYFSAAIASCEGTSGDSGDFINCAQGLGLLSKAETFLMKTVYIPFKFDWAKI